MPARSSKPAVGRQDPKKGSKTQRKFKGHKQPVPSLSWRSRAAAWSIIALLGLWFVPAFSLTASFVPTPLYLHAFAAVAVALWVLFKQSVAWVVPGLLATLGVIWAGGLAPDLLTGQNLGSPFPLWPDPPLTAAAGLLWRIVALVLASALGAVIAFSLAPRPTARSGRKPSMRR